MNTLIKGGTLITAAETFSADILISGEKISLIGNDLDSDNCQVVDASEKLLFPGGVDPHTHFDLPMFDTVSSDDHYTGHKAAAFGGTTTVLDFVPFDRDTIIESVEVWKDKAISKAAIDFGFHMNITRFDEKIESDIAILSGLGITSLKVFMAYNNRLRLQDKDIFRVMQAARENKLLTMLHAENGDVIDILVQEALSNNNFSPIWHALTRPPWGAVEATLRGAALSSQANTPLYIVHMNAGGEVDQLEYARKNGAPVMGETCPQYLFFTEENLKQRDGAKYICSPPMRSRVDNERIWQGLQSGSIQSIGTDHCPFFYDGTTPVIYEGKPVLIPGKELGNTDFTKIPNGVPGVGDRLPILWSYGVKAGRISANDFVKLVSTNPAKIFGLYPRKGCLAPGSDADIVIWDPKRELIYGTQYSHHRTDYNLFEGWKLVGFPEKVYLRGKLIVDQDQWLGYAGYGSYCYRDLALIIL